MLQKKMKNNEEVVHKKAKKKMATHTQIPLANQCVFCLKTTSNTQVFPTLYPRREYASSLSHNHYYYYFRN